MKDLTKEITRSDTRVTSNSGKLTRVDLLLNKLNIMKRSLDLSQPVTTSVFDETTGTREFVERITGTIEDTIEIVQYYGANFVLELTMRPNQNKVRVVMTAAIKKSREELSMDAEKKAKMTAETKEREE